MADVTTETISQAAPDPTLDSLQQFLDGIATTPLLTAEEELDSPAESSAATSTPRIT